MQFSWTLHFYTFQFFSLFSTHHYIIAFSDLYFITDHLWRVMKLLFQIFLARLSKHIHRLLNIIHILILDFLLLHEKYHSSKLMNDELSYVHIWDKNETTRIPVLFIDGKSWMLSGKLFLWKFELDTLFYFLLFVHSDVQMFFVHLFFTVKTYFLWKPSSNGTQFPRRIFEDIYILTLCNKV